MRRASTKKPTTPPPATAPDVKNGDQVILTNAAFMISFPQVFIVKKKKGASSFSLAVATGQPQALIPGKCHLRITRKGKCDDCGNLVNQWSTFECSAPWPDGSFALKGAESMHVAFSVSQRTVRPYPVSTPVQVIPAYQTVDGSSRSQARLSRIAETW